MISDASQPSVSRLVAERAMWLCIAPDKAFENVFCIKAILRLPTKNRFYESTQRLIQPRPVRWGFTERPGEISVNAKRGPIEAENRATLYCGSANCCVE